MSIYPSQSLLLLYLIDANVLADFFGDYPQGLVQFVLQMIVLHSKLFVHMFTQANSPSNTQIAQRHSHCQIFLLFLTSCNFLSVFMNLLYQSSLASVFSFRVVFEDRTDIVVDSPPTDLTDTASESSFPPPLPSEIYCDF